MPQDPLLSPSPETSSAQAHWLGYLKELIWWVLLAGMVGLVVSKAILSIASVAFPALCVIWRLLERGQPWQPARAFLWGFALMLGLSVWGFWLADSPAAWLKDVKGKLPFLLWALGMALHPRFSPRQYALLVGGFVLTVCIVAWLSLGMALADWGQVMERIKQNGSVPVVAHVSHIYFGLMLAFSVFLSAYLAINGARMMGLKRSALWYIPALLNFIALHFLASRTGVLAGYGSALGITLLFLFRTKAWRIGLVSLLVLLSIPWLSYELIPAFRTRVQVTIWDMQRFGEVDDLSHHTASLRLLAWRNAWQRFAEAPVFGVGISDVEVTMRAGYVKMGVPPETINLPDNPHNQYLEYLLGWGIIGGLIFLGLLGALIWRYPGRPIPLIFWAFWGIMVFGMMFESLLERQVGIAFFVIFSNLIPNWENSRS